ncbi:hypothetical protein METHPM2_450002 [Pseudomonas sp. PM2]
MPDFVEPPAGLQTKIPLDFILQMNELTLRLSLHVQAGVIALYTAPHCVGEGGPDDGQTRNQPAGHH